MDALRKIANLIQDPNVQIDTSTFVIALVISLLVSVFISLLYQFFYENRATGSQVHRSFVLLGPSITALFVAIQWSLPLSLGLLGALSIIRFRTPIKEPEEVGFIMLLIATSVVTATFQLLLLATLLLVAIAGLTVKYFIPAIGGSKKKDGIVLANYLSSSEGDAFDRISEVITKLIPKASLESYSETDGITSLQYSFCDLTADKISVAKLELAKIEDFKSINLYFNKSNSIL